MNKSKIKNHGKSILGNLKNCKFLENSTFTVDFPFQQLRQIEDVIGKNLTSTATAAVIFTFKHPFVEGKN